MPLFGQSTLLKRRNDVIPEPVMTVGIVVRPVLQMDFEGDYELLDGSGILSGPAETCLSGGSVVLQCGSFRQTAVEEIALRPLDSNRGSFILHGVTIGARFHWERSEDQRFSGGVRLRKTVDGILAINVVPLEEYLASVIASEMSPDAPGEFLRAHAITSRSWILAQREKMRRNRPPRPLPFTDDGETRLRWYDREAHHEFDVCADDHCQRFHGITLGRTPAVTRAIAETRGKVLVAGETICDARYAKSCGGISEPYENVWDPVHVPYLVSNVDAEPRPPLPGAETEEGARAWVRSLPDAFCNTADPDILRKSLRDVDRTTADFYRWRVEYGQEEFAALVARKSGVDFGPIADLIPLERGPSGRVKLLKIVGRKRSMAIGRELEIRRTLSPSHLYSSAFVVVKRRNGDDVPAHFTLIGAGWGHGVGLCQIGAAVMGARGYAHEAILRHYFPGTRVEKIY
jgi:SpoIID/LytB domain protein